MKIMPMTAMSMICGHMMQTKVFTMEKTDYTASNETLIWPPLAK
jgi:hypothetical protein